MIISIPLLPVTTGTLRGCDLISKMIGLCTHGMKKCVPSPTTLFLIPENLSNITALCPPSTINLCQKRIKHQKYFIQLFKNDYHYIKLNLQRRLQLQAQVPTDQFD